ncbi:flagellar protein FliS [Acidithiobacillus thiooxidans]|uniref:flagellar protein FliS n=1 Tax=Acidithiobacillus thiooxidans TaxID=930 RepID=UPI001C068C0E|nr:flagellar protein FliS [Acidithiobacillus thiooxidans]MBU2791902.1 flagellar protein FliS [Acidithiobacillus thiooxidans]
MAANPYNVVRNETATPLDLWDRGYRRCVALLQRAKVLMQVNDPAQRIEKARMLHDAFAIVEFWSAALPPAPPEVNNPALPGTASFPSRLRTAYGFVMHRIVKANANDCPGDIDEAMTMLAHLRVIFHKESS